MTENIEEKFALKIGSMTIESSTIMLVLQYAMEVVELTDLKGEAKKEMAIKLVRQAVQDAPLDDDMETVLLGMINQGILDYMINLIISASRGEININATIEVSKIACATLGPKAVQCLVGCIPKSKA